MQPVLNLVWKHLLPAMQAESLPPNPPAQKELEQKLETLEIAPLRSEQTGVPAAQVAGKQFGFADNRLGIKLVSLEFAENGGVLTVENKLGATKIAWGDGAWRKGISTYDGYGERRVAASGGWLDRETYRICLYFLTPVLGENPPLGFSANLPFGVTLTCRFKENELTFEQQVHQSFYPNKLTQLKGKAM
jgi:hypothetical protein